MLSQIQRLRGPQDTILVDGVNLESCPIDSPRYTQKKVCARFFPGRLDATAAIKK